MSAYILFFVRKAGQTEVGTSTALTSSSAALKAQADTGQLRP